MQWKRFLTFVFEIRNIFNTFLRVEWTENALLLKAFPCHAATEVGAPM